MVFIGNIAMCIGVGNGSEYTCAIDSSEVV